MKNFVHTLAFLATLAVFTSCTVEDSIVPVVDKNQSMEKKIINSHSEAPNESEFEYEEGIKATLIQDEGSSCGFYLILHLEGGNKKVFPMGADYLADFQDGSRLIVQIDLSDGYDDYCEDTSGFPLQSYQRDHSGEEENADFDALLEGMDEEERFNYNRKRN